MTIAWPNSDKVGKPHTSDRTWSLAKSADELINSRSLPLQQSKQTTLVCGNNTTKAGPPIAACALCKFSDLFDALEV